MTPPPLSPKVRCDCPETDAERCCSHRAHYEPGMACGCRCHVEHAAALRHLRGTRKRMAEPPLSRDALLLIAAMRPKWWPSLGPGIDDAIERQRREAWRDWSTARTEVDTWLRARLEEAS